MTQLYIVNHLFHEVLWILWNHLWLISASVFPLSRFWSDSGCGHRFGPARNWQLRYPLPYYKPGAIVAPWFYVCHQPIHWSHQSQCRWARQRGEVLKTYFTCLSVLSHLTVEMICVSNKFLFDLVQSGRYKCFHASSKQPHQDRLKRCVLVRSHTDTIVWNCWWSSESIYQSWELSWKNLYSQYLKYKWINAQNTTMNNLCVYRMLTTVDLKFQLVGLRRE